MERYHIYKLGLAILFYAVYFARQTVVNGLKIDDVTSTTNTTDYRERRDSGDDNAFFYQGADGTPGVDFPTLSYVPRTKFTCRDMEAGYYADLETDCQVFHICDEGRKLSFLCPNGTTFHQSELICDWWFKVNCSNSPLLYEESAEVLQRENAKRKDARRLAYQGTKQGVFSSKEDYDGQNTFRGTPAHLVTPSYRSSIKAIDNRISATTEGSFNRNYNARSDRTLESVGNGVSEKHYDRTNQYSTGHSQNNFNINLQVKPGDRDQSAFNTGSQQKASTVGQFSFSKDSHSTRSGGFASSNSGNKQQLSFDKSSQQNIRGHDQSTFGVNFANKLDTFGTSQFTSGIKTHVGQGSLDRNLQQTTTGRNQGTSGNNNVQTGFSGKQTTFGSGIEHQLDNKVSFDLSSQKTTSRQNQNIFGSSENGAQIQAKTKSEQTTFGKHYIDDGSRQSLFDGSSLDHLHGQNAFGARLQGTTSKFGQNSFAASLQGRTNTNEQSTFGRSTQQKANTSVDQVPLDQSSQKINEYEQNIFGRFSTNTQHSAGGSSSQIPLDRNSQKTTGRDQNLFGTGQVSYSTNSQQTSGESTGQIPLDRNSQRASGRSQNVFNRGQKTFDTTSSSTTQLSLDRSSQKANARDQNVFGRGQVTFGASTQQRAGNSARQYPLDRSSQKSADYDQKLGINIQQAGGSSVGQIPLLNQNVFERGQVTFGANTQQRAGSNVGQHEKVLTNIQQTVGNGADQIPLDRNSQRTNAFGRGQVTFSTNTQETIGSNAAQLPLGRNSQNTNENYLNVFGRFDTDDQQIFDSGSDKLPSDRTLHRTIEGDQNRFSTNLQKKIIDNEQNHFTIQGKTLGNEKNSFGVTPQQKTNNGQFGTGLGVTGSSINGGSDKIKFSISSQGKLDEFDANKQQNKGGYQQNIFSATSQNDLNEHGQTIPSRGSHTTIAGIGQNRFDLNLQGKSGQFEQTTSSFGLKAGGTTQNAFSFATQTEQQDDGGKIPVLIVSAETQEPQESASFVKSGRNNLLDNNRQATTNPYPNHRETYTDIKDPRHYYQPSHSKLPEKPFYGSSISPQVLSTVPVSASEGISRTTTEISPQKENGGFGYGLRTDISTTIKPTVDEYSTTTRENSYDGNDVASTTFVPATDAEHFSTGKSFVTSNRFSYELNEPQTTKPSIALNSDTQRIEVSTNKESNNFGQSTIPSTSKSVTIGSNKVDVTTYDRGYTNGVDLSLNSISSTLSPAFSEDIEVKSTTYPDSQKNNYYGGKFSTSSVGKSQFAFGSIGTEKPRANSPIIKLNIVPSTASPQFETNTRLGKAFNADSPQIQVITLDGSRTKDFSGGSFDLPGKKGDKSRVSISFGTGEQGRFISGGQTITPGFIKVKTNGISSNGNSFKVITGVNITPSVTFNRYGNNTTATGISSRTSATEANEYGNNFVSSTPSSKESSFNGRTVHININGQPITADGVNFGGSAQGNVNIDRTTSTRATPTEKETIAFNINDEIFTTPTSSSTETININVNNENHSTPASQYTVTRQSEFANTATTSTSLRDDILYTTPSSILQPKPFSVTTDTPFDSSKTELPGNILLEQTATPQVPSYSVSSASPFITTFRPRGTSELKTLTPTLPTPYTTESGSLYSYKPTDENINNVINTLMGVVKQRFGENSNAIGFGTPRPGLVVPPSAGPQTLHTLAIYFANALDNLTSSSPREKPEETDEESGTNSPIIHIDNEELIKSLLTQMTLNNYETLFKENDATTTELPLLVRTGADDEENDLIREDTKHPTEGPGVRQLARVFTEALSAYLEDPDTFKKVLHDVRPTEPPKLTFGNETTETDEDEVLNYSDSDLKSDHPHLPVRPTGVPVSPTWGYILAFNKSSPVSNNLELRNSLTSDSENLLSADSQSFVSQLNKVTHEFKTTLALDETKGTTEASDGIEVTNEDNAEGLPNNHWTTSSDVAKLWQTTLSINPAILNENFDSSQTAQDFTSTDIDTRFSTATNSEDDSSESSSDSGETTRVSEIQYELRALPKLKLNSTQVHGILIDFMNATKTEGSEKLQRILHKLNISQDEFLNKMKEIEGNPLTRRLILLLISECNTDRNKELETRSVSSDSVFGLAQSKLNSEKTEQPVVTSGHDINVNGDAPITESNSFKHIVHPSLDDDDEDTRALELLNSLYVIASKFGK